MENQLLTDVLGDNFVSFLYDRTRASKIRVDGVIQTLWSGYGRIMRLALEGADRESVIIKHVKVPESIAHPRGWHTKKSHERKMRSYEIEMQWYQHWSNTCDEWCRVPACFGVMGKMGIMGQAHENLIILEDLDASGFSTRVDTPELSDVKTCVAWLANLHARFLGRKPEGLWPVGTYWHLETRPDELSAMPDGPLKDKASELDRRLTQTNWQTIVHGDAKISNFCFSQDRKNVAAVDFQYVGGGCGMKDLAYFISSCWDEAGCEQYSQAMLDYYFEVLNDAITKNGSDVNIAALEAEWRQLYSVAWADFYRFLLGWSPGHWKIHGYSARMVREALDA